MEEFKINKSKIRVRCLGCNSVFKNNPKGRCPYCGYEYAKYEEKKMNIVNFNL